MQSARRWFRVPYSLDNRQQRVIAGSNETFIVGDHDFAKLLLIPDAKLLNELLQPDDGEGSPKVGKWYIEQVYYGLKSVVTEGFSAMRCAAEHSKVMTQHLEKLRARCYAYTDGGPKCKVDNSLFQNSCISLFLKHDFDEILVASIAPNLSSRNPVKRCH